MLKQINKWCKVRNFNGSYLYQFIDHFDTLTKEYYSKNDCQYWKEAIVLPDAEQDRLNKI